MKDQVLLVQTSEEELLGKISLKIQEILENHFPKPKEEIIYIDRAEACKILNISPPTLLEWVKKGYIKAHRIGKRRRYIKKEIEEAYKKVDFMKYKRSFNIS